MFTLFAQVHIKLNMETMTVRSFEERILKGALNMVAPDAEIDGKGVILLSSEEVLCHVLFDKINGFLKKDSNSISIANAC